MVLAFFPAVQQQVHNANPVRYGRNTDALVNLNTKLSFFSRGEIVVALAEVQPIKS